jgi:hypothetical protein
MNAPRDPDRLIHAFLQEGEEMLQDPIYDEVRAVIEHKRQRTFFGPWRLPIMNRTLAVGLGTAAVVVIGLLLGAQLLGPINLGGSDPTPTPEPSATLQPSSETLASGSFTVPLGEFGEAVDIDAVRTGDVVSGTIHISDPAGAEGAYSVDVQCAGTTNEGFLLIGGQVTESTYTQFIEDGAYVVIVLAPGTPVRMLWAADVLATDEVPAPAESCSAYLDTVLGEPEFVDAVDVQGRPIEGDVELGV